MRVLVTGAGGFIGGHMVKYLKSKGHWVRAVDIKFPDYRKDLWSQADQVKKYDLRYMGDDFSLGGMLVENTKDVNWIFHFACDMGGVGYFFSPDDGKASANNMQIDLNMLEVLKPEQRMFYSSSFCAYPIKDQVLVDGKAKRAMTEEDFGEAPAEAIYGEEKRLATILYQDARKNRDLDIRTALFSTIYGPYQEVDDPKKSKFPTAILKKAMESDGDIEIWGDGTQVRTFLYIDEAIERMYRVLSAPEYHGLVNIGSDEQVTIKEMADYACELVGVKPNYTFNLDKPTGVMGKDTDNSKYNRIYGEVPQTSARDGFKKLYDYFKKNRNQSPSEPQTG